MINDGVLDSVIDLVKMAGQAIMKIYTSDFNVHYKSDSSPVTAADYQSNKVLCNGLKLILDIPILSEENKVIPYEIRKKWKYYWCIDPIDGTKEFINKNNEFTVNVALIYENTPVLGVVYAPALDLLYYAQKDKGAYKNDVKLPIKRKDNKLVIVVSRSHLSPETKNFLDSIQTNKEKQLVRMGSSLKLCLVAEGAADIYPRLSPTMEWDTAASHIVVLEANKQVLEYGTDKVLTYNKKQLLNSYFFHVKS